VRVVVASYDPNDKHVSPQGETSYGLIPPTTPTLEYAVNFQNTGNWPATYVVIRDTIDDDLEITSIDMQMASHPCTVTVEQDKILVFTFNNINLPDSTTDEPNSHGFVKFGMNLKSNLPLDTHIDNTAYIYFDFNAPVITNTTHNTLYEKMEIAMNQNFVVCPGDVINIDVQKGRMSYNFFWSNGTSNLNSMNGNLTIPANFANGVQSVVVSDFYGASKTIYFTVTNQAIANANFSFTSAGNLFFFNANDLGLTTYAWDFGNGQTSNLPTNNITFASAGSYQVSLIVTDNCGGRDTMTQTIVVSTDISDAAFAQSLTLFPNPTHNISTFSFYNPDNSPYQLTISDLSGKALQTIPDIRSEKVEVNHENKAKGAYLWELKGTFTARGMLWVE
jgi:PKD domain